MDTVKVRAKDNHNNVLEVDQSNADLLIARGTWEKVPSDDKEEVTKDDGSKPSGRRRAPRSSSAS